jgi:hypothetical protein
LERVATTEQWGDWQDLGGILEGSPAAVGSASRKHVDVAGVIEDAGHPGLWLRSWPFQKPCFVPGDACGSCREACGGSCSQSAAPAASPAFFVDANGDDSWVFRGTDGHVYSVVGDTAKPIDLALATKSEVLAQGDPAAFLRADGYGSVVFRSISQEVYEDFQHEAAWGSGNLTQYAEAPTIAGDPVGYVRGDGVTSIVVRDSLGSVRELYLLGDGWHDANLSLISFAPGAASNPHPLVRADQVSSLYFRNTDGGLSEIYLAGNWISGALALPANVKAAGEPSTFVGGDSRNNVIFRSQAGEVFQLTAAAASHVWSATSLTLATGAPPAASDPQGYERGDGVDAVVYRTASGAVFELSRTGTTWSVLNLTAVTAAPPALDHPVPYVRADSRSGIAYLAAGGSIIELVLDDGKWTQRVVYAPQR